MILSILFSVFFLIFGSLALIWAINPKGEEAQVQATQGIRLVGNAVFYNSTDSSKPNVIRVGDLLMGSDEEIYRINEIRKSQNNTIYIVVSWKILTNYTTFEDYQSDPYTDYRTYELNSFAYNKDVVTEDELEDFYLEYAQQLDRIRQEEEQRRLAAAPSAPRAAAPSARVAPTPTAPTGPTAPISPSQQSTPRSMADSSAQRTDAQQVQTYSIAEVAEPENVDQQALDRSVEAAAAEQIQAEQEKQPR